MTTENVKQVLDDLEKTTTVFAKPTFDRLAAMESEERHKESVEGLDQLIWGILVSPTFNTIEYGMVCGYVTTRFVLAPGIYTFEESLEYMKFIISTYLALATNSPLSLKAQETLEYYKHFVGTSVRQ